MALNKFNNIDVITNNFISINTICIQQELRFVSIVFSLLPAVCSIASMMCTIQSAGYIQAGAADAQSRITSDICRRSAAAAATCPRSAASAAVPARLVAQASTRPAERGAVRAQHVNAVQGRRVFSAAEADAVDGDQSAAVHDVQGRGRWVHDGVEGGASTDDAVTVGLQAECAALRQQDQLHAVLQWHAHCRQKAAYTACEGQVFVNFTALDRVEHTTTTLTVTL